LTSFHAAFLNGVFFPFTGGPAEEEAAGLSCRLPGRAHQDPLGVARLAVIQTTQDSEQDQWLEQRMAAMEERMLHLTNSVAAIMDHLGSSKDPYRKPVSNISEVGMVCVGSGDQ
ncbi:hypothetical protein JD844_002707, partial [Phrynosoma platyrhinos]